MKFGHIHEGRLVYARLPIVIADREYFTEDAAWMLAAGEKEIIDTPEPETRTDGRYTASWTETETQILRTWTFVPYTEEELHERYRGLCVRYIHDKYPISDENKILREYLAYGEAAKTAFEEYNAYVEACKVKAYCETYGEEDSKT